MELVERATDHPDERVGRNPDRAVRPAVPGIWDMDGRAANGAPKAIVEGAFDRRGTDIEGKDQGPICETRADAIRLNRHEATGVEERAVGVGWLTFNQSSHVV